MVEQTDDRILGENMGDPPPGVVQSVMVCPACGHENLMGIDQCANCDADLRTSDIPMAATDFERLLTQVPLSVAATELLWRQVIEDLDVPSRDVAVPLGHATARDRDYPPGVNAVAILEPAEERNPVQDLEADL